MDQMIRDTSQTLEERISTTHVQSLDVDLTAMAVITNVFRVSVMFRNLAERHILDEHNISFSGFTVLWVLWVFGRKQSFELAEECGIAKGTLTGIVKTLEKYGWARRKSHQTDGRRKYVELSAKGRKLMERIFPKVNHLEKKFTQNLNNQEQEQLGRALRIMLNTNKPPLEEL